MLIHISMDLHYHNTFGNIQPVDRIRYSNTRKGSGEDTKCLEWWIQLYKLLYSVFPIGAKSVAGHPVIINLHFIWLNAYFSVKYSITRPLTSLKRGNSVKTSEDFSSSRTILRRYSNVIFIFCLIVASSEEWFMKDMASLHCSSFRIISGLNEAALLAVGPPPVSWPGDLMLSDDALFLWMVFSLHAK